MGMKLPQSAMQRWLQNTFKDCQSIVLVDTFVKVIVNQWLALTMLRATRPRFTRVDSQVFIFPRLLAIIYIPALNILLLHKVEVNSWLLIFFMYFNIEYLNNYIFCFKQH